MKYFLPVFAIISTMLVCFSPIVAHAQHNHEVITECHATEAELKLLESHPELIPEIETADQELEAFTRNFENLRKDGELYTIPVVFHIVHNWGDENISNAQVENCIDVMNEYYSGENSSLGGVQPAFQDIIANVGFQFALARKTPNGDCTNGIVRTASQTTYQGGGNLKEVSPIWDRSMYLNVWVCRNIESGAAGYSYRPNSVNGAFGESNDGIVVRYDYVGVIEESSPNRATTMPHEAGHWLNLKHVWGGTNSAAEPGNCGSDDSVSDTPLTLGWTSCDLDGETCGTLDNVENIMEYSGCRKMFTIGQAERMESALNSNTAERFNLWQEENLIATGVFDEAVVCHADFFTNDERIICIGQEIAFSDLSFNGVTDWEWTFEGGTPATSNEASPVVHWENPGTFDVTLTVSNENGSESISKEDYIQILSPGENVLPFEEGFEAFESLEANTENWFVKNELYVDDKWELSESVAYSGSKSVFVNGRTNDENAIEYLSSPTFDLSELTENAVLTFKYAHARRSSMSDDKLRIFISKNCGDNWSLRKTIGMDDLPTVSSNVSGTFAPDGQEDWTEVSIDNIVSVFLNDQFRIRFEFTSYRGNNIYIDDINIFDGATVGLEGVTFVNTLELYPNPTTNNAVLKYSLENSGNVIVDILDISGRRVAQIYNDFQPAGTQALDLDLSNLVNGLYMVRVQGSGQQVLRKLVKQ